MGRYLYDCEVTNNTLFLKIANITGTTMQTEIRSIYDLVQGTVTVDNVQVNANVVTMEGKQARSARELMDIIKSRGNISAGQTEDGSALIIDKLGRLHIMSTPATKDKLPTTMSSAQANAIDRFAEKRMTSVANNLIQKQRELVDQLVEKLNIARDSYYNKNQSLMSDKTYDELYDKLEALEKETGYIRPDSPTQNVGAGKVEAEQHKVTIPQGPVLPVPDYSSYKQGEKVQLEDAALSLAKTKDVNELANLLDNGEGVLSVKMDGLTLILEYVGTKLVYASTRGNGTIGEFCLANAQQIEDVPDAIPYGGRLKVRGEAYLDYRDFEAINATLQEDDKYKNPRNLASGTIRTFNKPEIVRQRKLRFAGFEIVNWKDLGLHKFTDQLDMLSQLGFKNITKHIHVTKGQIHDAVEALTATVKASSIPADGLVLRLNDLELGERLGVATKYPRHSLAFKWEDAEVETQLKSIEWQVGRTGRITPIAVFKPVDIEGSTVEKASLHNLSMLEELLGQPYVDQTIWVYKANLIIPQVARGDVESPIDTNRILEGPDYCPCCGSDTTMNVEPSSGVKTLWCLNKSCPAKGLQQWAHFVERDAMNVNGLGESILQDLLDLSIINNNLSSLYTATPADYFRLCVELEGYGEKKVTNILDAIEKSKTVPLENVLYAYGIPNIGLQTAKVIVKLADYDLDELSSLTMIKKILNTNGLGQVVAHSWKQFMLSDRADDFFGLCDLLNLVKPAEQTAELSGLTFCCTGDVYQYNGRKELQASIERRGGKFTTSVTGNTNYLITNTPDSNTAKNKAADAKGIPKITEQQFIDMFGR